MIRHDGVLWPLHTPGELCTDGAGTRACKQAAHHRKNRGPAFPLCPPWLKKISHKISQRSKKKSSTESCASL
jgi:hypothetical protein